MAITLKASKHVGYAGTTSDFSVGLTTGWEFVAAVGSSYSIVSGDFLVVSLATGSTADRDLPTNTAGSYTEAFDIYSDDTVDTNFSMQYKFATGAVTTFVITGGSQSASDAGNASVQVWGGVDNVTPFDVTTQTVTGIDTGQPTPPSITPITPGATICCVAASGFTTTADFTQSGAQLTNFLSESFAGTNDCTMGSGMYEWVNGLFVPVPWTGNTTNTGASWAACSYALRPAVPATRLPYAHRDSYMIYTRN